MYHDSFYLQNPTGNNAFSFDIRKERRLFVPSLIDGGFSDVRIGNQIVFADIGENGKLQECIGLEHFIKTTWNQIPVYIFDNHNHAFYFWHEAKEAGIIRNNATLIHIDEHSDLREPVLMLEEFLTTSLSAFHHENAENSPNPLQMKTEVEHPSTSSGGQKDGLSTCDLRLKTIFRYTNEILEVGNYIRPAEKSGLINKTYCILTEGQLLEYKGIPLDDNMILNIDLDFFEPRLDDISFSLKKEAILHFARHARLITIATSPFFIDQELAIETLHKLFHSEEID